VEIRIGSSRADAAVVPQHDRQVGTVTHWATGRTARQRTLRAAVLAQRGDSGYL